MIKEKDGRFTDEHCKEYGTNLKWKWETMEKCALK